MSDGLQNFPEFSLCPGGGHATSRKAELFMPAAPKSSWFKPLPCRMSLITTLDPSSPTAATTAFTTAPTTAISAPQASTRMPRRIQVPSRARSVRRAGTATPPSPGPTARTARSAQLGTMEQALAPLSAPLAQQVDTGNSPARRARHALPSAQRALLQHAHWGPRAQWHPSLGFTWRMLRPRSRDRVQRASSNQA
jgi:hypothetical protein